MKGLINTDNLLHAVLNKETGILPKGRVLTHVTATEIPTYPKLIFFTDPAVIPYPTQEQRMEQVRYVADLCHSFGIEEPRLSLIHCTEKPNEKFFPFTIGYKDIIDEAKKGTFGKCIVDGPLDVKTSCDLEAMQTKGIESPIAGEADALIFPDIEAGPLDAKCACSMHAMEAKGLTSPLEGDSDILIMPDIEAGNVFYKTVTLFCGAETAATLKGPLAPVVLTSRGDSIKSKFYSLALAIISA